MDNLTLSKYTDEDGDIQLGHTAWYINDFGPFKSEEHAKLWLQLQAEIIKHSKPIEESTE